VVGAHGLVNAQLGAAAAPPWDAAGTRAVSAIAVTWIGRDGWSSPRIAVRPLGCVHCQPGILPSRGTRFLFSFPDRRTAQASLVQTFVLSLDPRDELEAA